MINTTVGGLGLVDGRARLLSTTDSLQKSSLDYYATLRSMSQQRRVDLVAQGKAGLVKGEPDGAALPTPWP